MTLSEWSGRRVLGLSFAWLLGTPIVAAVLLVIVAWWHHAEGISSARAADGKGQLEVIIAYTDAELRLLLLAWLGPPILFILR